MLITAIGWAIQHFGGVRFATVIGLFVGVLAARLVPGGSCSVPQKPNTTAAD